MIAGESRLEYGDGESRVDAIAGGGHSAVARALSSAREGSCAVYKRSRSKPIEGGWCSNKALLD